MAARLYVAKQLYEANCAAHPGNDADGQPPTWASLLTNPDKRAQVEMWLAAADRSIAQPPRQVHRSTGGWG